MPILRPIRRLAGAGLAAAALVAASVLPGPAAAGPTPQQRDEARKGRPHDLLSNAAHRRLGDQFACVVNPDAPQQRGRLQLNVTSRAALPEARAILRERRVARARAVVTGPRYSYDLIERIGQRMRPPLNVRLSIGEDSHHCYIVLDLTAGDATAENWAKAWQTRHGTDRIVIRAHAPGTMRPT
jgi:hypothetical protein